jgi:hypothetical protein
MAFELITGFIDHLQLVTTNHYKTFSSLHALKIIVAHAKTQAVIVFTFRC